jgi:hypothetical protein
MLEEWIDSKLTPGARVKVRPLDGPRMYTVAARGFKDGEAMYQTFAWAALDWENVPTLRGKTLEKYDPASVNHLTPDIVMEVVTHLVNGANVSEEERKN